MNYCDAVTYEDVEEYEVRRWIGNNLNVISGDEIEDEYLAQSPYRRLVIVPDVTPEPWQSVEVEHVVSEVEPVVTRNPVLVDAPVEEFAAHRKEAIAAARWQAQNAGINIGGVDIDTGNDTALYISAALQKLPANPSMTLSWKTKAGTFVSLGATELTVIGDAIFVHVQNCFGTEKDRIEAIDEIVADSELTDQQKLAAISAVTWDDPS